MIRFALSIVASVIVLAAPAPETAPATASKPLPPTNVAVNSGYIVVSTTAKTSRLDTSVYISDQTPGENFIYHSAIPATISNDAAWNCPCVAQITVVGKNGTSKVLTAPSAPFIPSP
jgi:hypothetical protein